MINKKELKEEKVPSDLYQFCLLRQEFVVYQQFYKKKK